MTTWYYKNPGHEILIPQDAESEGEFLIADQPDWVRAPDYPGIPGGPRKVLGIHIAPCPHPGHKHLARHYKLEGVLQVAECTEVGFLWYKKTT